jgi:hypothetical protein
MGTLVFVCPTTGHEVSTGVEVDRSNYKRLSIEAAPPDGVAMTEPHKQILLAVGIAALVWIVLFAIYRVAVMQPIWN